MRNWSEARVFELCEAYGLEPMPTSPLEDSRDHVDITVELEGIRLGIDVKAPRRLARQDATFSYWYTWLELRNRNGLRGSLFGSATFIVIGSPRGWLWMKREDLAAECVLRYIEQTGSKDINKPWWTKQRGQSVIILTPYTYLYKHAVYRWEDGELRRKYYAAYKQEADARPVDT